MQARREAQRDAKHPLIARPGWFSDENKWKTTPAASASVAARNFIHDAATPPCGDARRGIAALLQLIHSFPVTPFLVQGGDFSFPFSCFQCARVQQKIY